MLKPVQILTGHEDIRGAEEVHAALTRIIDSVQWVHDRTVEGMNAGVDVRTLMQETETPEHLTLTEEYGKVAWNIRAIWHEYTGWYDPSRGITELYGVPFSSVAPTLIDLIGGEKELIRKANAFSDQGKPIEALHLLDIALAANPESVEGRKARGKSLSLLLEQSSGKNLWERMSISAELSDLED